MRAAYRLHYFFSGGVTIRPHRKYFRKPPKTNLPRANEQIRAREIRLIGPDGEQIGVLHPREALEKAKDLGLDLVEIAPQAKPPVCRIMDFGKYKYDLRRKEREARKKQKTVDVKQLTMRLNIEDHDLKIKVNHALDFLASDHKVKFILRLRGREIGNKEKSRELFDRIVEFLGDAAKVEKEPDFRDRQVIMIVAPTKAAGKPQPKEEKPDAKDED